MALSAYYETKNYDEAVAHCNAIIMLSASSDAQVARAYKMKAYIQSTNLENHENSFRTFDELIKRFSATNEAGVQEQVASAYVNKGFAQGEHLKDPDLAMATYDELIKKFGDSDIAGVQEQVARAINGNAFNQLILLKKEWRKIKAAERKTTLNSVLELFKLALEKNDQNAAAMGNIAYCLWLLNDKAEVEPILKQALIIGGETLYDGTVEDTEMHSVSADKTFKKTLDKVWAEVQAEQKQQDGDDSQDTAE